MSLKRYGLSLRDRRTPNQKIVMVLQISINGNSIIVVNSETNSFKIITVKF